MNSMLGRLEEARAREERFVADASHELRSPISAVRAQLETALAHQGGVEWPAVARTVLDEELSMERLISELLLLARADAGALPGHRIALDLRQLVQVELDSMDGREGVTVDASAVSEARVVGDPDQLARVIRNVVENAQRHAASSVSIEVAVAGQNAEVIVTDDGPGIPPSDRERVFDRFTRLDEARSRRSGGVGLGLSIAKEIVTAKGGSIAVTDTAKGARILIRLPLASGVEPRVHFAGRT
jgi:signal transduction histidine kinase